MRFAVLFVSALLAVLFASAFSAEKVLFGEPAPIAAEGRQTPDAEASKDAKKTSGRQARVFTFPGSSQQQQPDSRTLQNAYVISTPYQTDERFSAPSEEVQDENRLLSILPSLGGDGMQVGLDFKLPFFSIPYAKMFSALSSPSIGSSFGSSLGSSIFGSGSYGSAPAGGTLSSNLLGSGSGLSSGMATAAAMAVTAALLYPKVTGLFTGKELSFRDGGSTDEFMHSLNSVLGQFNIDGEACMKMALCSVGNAKRHQRTRARDPSGGVSTTPADILEDVLNLPFVKNLMNKGGLSQARNFGDSGGDCDYFNVQNKCPIAAQTFEKVLKNLG